MCKKLVHANGFVCCDGICESVTLWTFTVVMRKWMKWISTFNVAATVCGRLSHNAVEWPLAHFRRQSLLSAVNCHVRFHEDIFVWLNTCQVPSFLSFSLWMLVSVPYRTVGSVPYMYTIGKMSSIHVLSLCANVKSYARDLSNSTVYLYVAILARILCFDFE